jgi:hypothetical protein
MFILNIAFGLSWFSIVTVSKSTLKYFIISNHLWNKWLSPCCIRFLSQISRFVIYLFLIQTETKFKCFLIDRKRTIILLVLRGFNFIVALMIVKCCLFLYLTNIHHMFCVYTHNYKHIKIKLVYIIIMFMKYLK